MPMVPQAGMPGTTPGLPNIRTCSHPLSPRTSDPCGLSLLPPSYLIAEGGVLSAEVALTPSTRHVPDFFQDPRFLISGTFWSWETTAAGAPRHLPALPCPGSSWCPERRGDGPQGVVLPGVETPFPLPALHLAPQPLPHTCAQGPLRPQFSAPVGLTALARGSTSQPLQLEGVSQATPLYPCHYVPARF